MTNISTEHRGTSGPGARVESILLRNHIKLLKTASGPVLKSQWIKLFAMK